MKAVIEKKTRKKNVYFTISWSDFLPMEKHLINNKVPSIAGIFEVYYLDTNKTLRFIGRDRAYYGGLRNTLRQISDPALPSVVAMEAVPTDRPLYFRYSHVESQDDMDDLLYFLEQTRFSEQDVFDHSGRYTNIYVNEHSPGGLHSL